MINKTNLLFSKKDKMSSLRKKIFPLRVKSTFILASIKISWLTKAFKRRLPKLQLKNIIFDIITRSEPVSQ